LCFSIDVLFIALIKERARIVSIRVATKKIMKDLSNISSTSIPCWLKIIIEIKNINKPTFSIILFILISWQ
jgi:hypothetical protein